MREKLSNSKVDELISSVISDGKEVLFVRTKEHELLPLVQDLQVICFELINSNEDCFRCESKTKLDCSPLGKRFLTVVGNELLEQVDSIFPEFLLNPLLKEAVDVINGFELGYLIRSLPRYQASHKVDLLVERLNLAISDIRKRMATEDYQRVFRNYERGVAKNRKSSSALVDKIFEGRYHKVLVVRMDLSYKKDLARVYMPQNNISEKDVRRHLATLLRDMRSKLFKKNFITYIWKLEYGPLKGYHYHAFFFFDGTKVMRDICLGQAIGDYWNDVATNGAGVYYNCNKKKELYPHPAIGMIDRRDLEKIGYLKDLAIEYLHKVDYYVKPVSKDKGRFFGKGGIPKPSKNSPGRQRGCKLTMGTS